MAKDVPFHSTFTSGFLKDAESEARTAICTKIGLEQLTSTPNFTAKLWSIRIRKFVADTFFPAVENEDDQDVPIDCKKSNLGVYKAFSFVLFVSLLWLATSQTGLETSVSWIRHSFFQPYGRSSTKDDSSGAVQSEQFISPIVPALFRQAPGWCHPVQLWQTAPHCGPNAGQWDQAPLFISNPVSSPTSFLGAALVQELTSTVQRIADALPQQEQVNSYIFQAINSVVHDVGHMKSQVLEITRDSIAQLSQPQQTEFKSAEPTAQSASPITILVSLALSLVVMCGFAARQSSRHNADMLKIMQQCQQLQEQVCILRALPEKLGDIESQVKRQQKVTSEFRADNFQLHEDLREKLDLSVQDMNMTQTQLAGLLAGLTSDIRFLKSEAQADMSRFREAIGELEAEREALHAELEQRDQQNEEGQKQLEACFAELQATNAQLMETTEKLRVREEGVTEMAALMHDLQEELQRSDETIAEKTIREQELLEQLDAETKNRIANEGYVDILRNQHDILTKAVVSMNEYLDADENMRMALEGRVADLEGERDTLISQLTQSRDAEQSAVRNADRYRKEVTEKEKLLHYRKYEMEMLMKMAKENNTARTTPTAAI